MSETCPHGHQINSRDDRDSQGFCLVCRQDHNKREALKRKAAMDVCRGLEKFGVTYMDGDRAVTAEQLAEQLLKRFGDTA